MFNSKYPIIALGMNRVSNLSLALAVSEAGAIATISGFNYINKDSHLDTGTLTNDFRIYENQRKYCDFIFSIDDKLLVNNQHQLLENFVSYKIQYIELMLDPYFLKNNSDELTQVIKKLKDNNIKLFTKLLSLNSFHYSWTSYITEHFDGIIIKSSNGAGRVSEESNSDLKELVYKSIEMFPTKFIIPCGGVGTAHEIKDLLDAGAGAVGIGTLFAAAKESPLSTLAKEKLVNANSEDLKKLKTYDFNQSALVFSKIDQNITNNTRGLVKGITTGEEGHIFAGKSINNITNIKSVKDIITDLCTLL
jgi:NAD(P)H-dependent flavin oxidoreductase YrpB (nitropropane dioxygenase family)